MLYVQCCVTLLLLLKRWRRPTSKPSRGKPSDPYLRPIILPAAKEDQVPAPCLLSNRILCTKTLNDENKHENENENENRNVRLCRSGVADLEILGRGPSKEGRGGHASYVFFPSPRTHHYFRREINCFFSPLIAITAESTCHAAWFFLLRAVHPTTTRTASLPKPELIDKIGEFGGE